MSIGLKGILIKSAGAGGLGLGIYDAHCKAKRTSKSEAKNMMADTMLDAWMNKNRMDTDSDIDNILRNEAFNFRLDSPLPKIIGNIKGYIVGFLKSISDNVVPITLSTGALVSKKGGKMSKIFGSGLGIYAIYKIISSFTSSARTRTID